MARPVKVRSTEAFARDLQTLAHLRTSLLLDLDLDVGRAKQAVSLIDEITEILLEFSRARELDEQVLKVSG